MSRNPWKQLVIAHQKLNTARNYLDDAMAEISQSDYPATMKNADAKRDTLLDHIETAEIEIERAKKELGVTEE